jgi:hypothetical protein
LVLTPSGFSEIDLGFLMQNNIAVEAAKSAIKAIMIDGYSGTWLGMPTAMMVPVKADAGMVPDTVWGGVKVVATETHPFPFQYLITLALVKLGFEKLTVTETPEPRAPLLEVTLTS